MPDISWNEKAEYLTRTRVLYLNDDYLEFLVRKVWKLNTRVDVIDFGCGFGYMGMKLLPLLQQGSTYTGLDIATSLLEKGREIFKGIEYNAQFIEADVTTVELPDGAYDVAFCHALLLHVIDPVAILKRMKDCVKPSGLIICIEPSHIGAMAGYYHGGRQSEYADLGILQKLYENSAEQTGKDGNVGLKLPLHMEQAGLTEIECRRSDKVNVLLSNQAEAQRTDMRNRLSWDGCGNPPKNPPDAFRERLVARGLTPGEADRQYAAETTDAASFTNEELEVVWACGMMISFGRVPR